MRYGLVVPKTREEANYIASFTWKEYNLFPVAVDAVFGIIDIDDQMLVGSALFSQFNGYNAELSYYGAGVLTLGMIRSLAREVLKTSIIRVTIRQPITNPPNPATRATKKFGFIEEGIERDFYGPGKDCVRLVIFKDGIERLAGIKHTIH